MESDTHGRTRFTPVDGSAFTMRADLVLLAMGFTGADPQLASAFEAPLSPRGAFAVEHEHRTNVPGLYVAGDARRGASLIVWAIREGRDAAAQIDAELSLV
jgi:glutamate synthase (NADPH/NADH) small chain